MPTYFRFLVSCAFSVVMSATGAGLCASDFEVAYSMPKRGVCAHRGASDTHPENTLAAFREAVMLGAAMIEFDVALTKDGQLVLMHDSTVDRTTDGTGQVAELTLDEVRKLRAGRWKDERFQGERVPTLDEALAMMPANIWLNVHLKGGTALAEKTARAIADAERLHQCFLACDRDAADAAKTLVPEILICNMDRQNNSQHYVDETIAAKADFIQLYGGESVDPEHTRQLREAGVHINYCCANDADKVKALFEAGVEFPLVDKLQDMLVAADTLGIERLTPVYRARSGESTEKVVAKFEDGEAQVVPEFEDPGEWIHHDLWVEAEFDSDGDGNRDRMHVSVTRQRQTDTQGLKVPVVYVSSPYFSGTASDTRDFFWDPHQELGTEPAAHNDPPSIKHQSRRLVISKSHWDDWVPRGFAVLHSASPGTGLSQGCPTIGGDNESLAPKAVIDWLNGRAAGFTTPYGDERVTGYWSTGKVGMTGTSYNGTIPLAAATTGVDGLEAIIPVAPNTSYYHYYRSNGLVRHPGGYMGEDIDVLYNYVNSGNPERREFCNCNVRDKEMAEGFDRGTGDYNAFWAGRDYLNDLQPMKAAMLMAHGFNDWNVMPEHSVRIYKAVQAKGVPVQCYFHQAGHGGQPPLKLMNRWFTRYLYGIDNGVEKDPKAWIVREHDDRMKPTAYPDYPNPRAEPVTLRPGSGGVRLGTLALEHDGEQGSETLVDNFSFSGATLAQADWTEHRLLYVSETLKSPLHISGTARMSIRLSCDRPAANLSVWLVSLPWSKDSDAPIYENIITRGWADPQNHSSLNDSEPLVPGQYYDMTFDLQPDDQIIPAGQQIGLMLFSTDRDFTLWPKPGTKLTIDLDSTTITLPVVGGRQAFTHAVASAVASENVRQQPNIVLLMGDDHGWDETAYNGHPHLRTPVLDEMAASGLRLDHFYSAHPTCSPTRGSVITGRHPNRYGTFAPNWSIRPEEISIAQILGRAGYACGHFGKWHLGPVKVTSPTNPEAMGFHEWLSHDNFFELNPYFSRNGALPEQFEGESSEILIEETIRFIGEAKERDQPFFAVVWFGSPHEPYSGLDEDLALYDDLPEEYRQRQVKLTSNETGQQVERPLNEVLRERYAEITAMDRSIGRLRHWLEEKNLRRNTLLWYCGDNGTSGDGIVTSPFRGQKATMYEGGIRVPGIIEWPERIPEPRVSNVNSVTSDIPPTLCEITGQPLPDRPVDGISLTPLIDGKMTERSKPICFWSFNDSREADHEPWIEVDLQQGTTPLVKLMDGVATRSFRNFRHPDVTEHDFDGPRVILDNRYKLVVGKGADDAAKMELFDLSNDIAEEHNLIESQPEIAADLQEQLRDWQQSVLNSLTAADYPRTSSESTDD